MGSANDEVRPSDDQQLLTAAVAVATEAADLARSSRRSAIADVGTKSSETDVVTAADKAVEELVRAHLGRLRPGEPVLGEEGGGEVAENGTCWVVDPIDGTVNYLYGYPWYSVSLAAQRDGVSVAGVVVEPVSGRTWTAVRGRGADCDGEPLRVSGGTRLDLAMVGTGFGYLVERRSAQARMVARLLPEVRDIRRSGCASLDLCSVAAGWLDGYAEHGLHRWDWAAGALIAAEAGATVSLPGSDPALGTDLTLASAPGITAELRSLLATSGAGAIP